MKLTGTVQLTAQFSLSPPSLSSSLGAGCDRTSQSSEAWVSHFIPPARPPGPPCASVVASPPSLFSTCPPHGPDMSNPLEGVDGGGDPRPGESFCSGGAPSPGPPQHRPCPGPSLTDDTDANSNGSSGNESNGPESRGASQRSSHSSSSGNGKDSALLETTESSKRYVWLYVIGLGNGLVSRLN